MSGWPRTSAEIELLLRRAAEELDRAARAGNVASRHEAMVRAASQGSGIRALHQTMAQLHRQLEQRHITAGRIHQAHAERIRSILAREARGLQPAFMAAVAEISRADSALLSLFGHQAEALVISTDKTAAAAHDLELALDEGPARDAVAERELVAAAGDALEERWPLYGPAAARLGIRAAAAAPLGTQDRCLGSLTVFGLQPGGDHDGASLLGSVADALTHTVLLGDGTATRSRAAGVDDILIPLPVQGNRLLVVHQAAGMVAAECGCGIADALAIIRAHAFAQSQPVEAVAAKVVSRKLDLGSDVLT